VLGSNNYSTV
jgi:hypothetical protein